MTEAVILCDVQDTHLPPCPAVSVQRDKAASPGPMTYSPENSLEWKLQTLNVLKPFSNISSSRECAAYLLYAFLNYYVDNAIRMTECPVLHQYAFWKWPCMEYCAAYLLCALSNWLCIIYCVGTASRMTECPALHQYVFWKWPCI